MSTPHRRPHQSQIHDSNKENIPPGFSSRRGRTKSLYSPLKFSVNTGAKGYEQQHERETGEENDEEIPFMGLSRQEISSLRGGVEHKRRFSSVEENRRRRMSGKFEVLRDSTREYVNRDVQKRLRGRKALKEVADEEGGIEEGGEEEDYERDFDNFYERGGESGRKSVLGMYASDGELGDTEELENIDESEIEGTDSQGPNSEGEEGSDHEGLESREVGAELQSIIEELETSSLDSIEDREIDPTEADEGIVETDIEPGNETFGEQDTDADTDTESLDGVSVFTASSQDMIEDIESRPTQPPRTDNLAIRTLLHSSSYTDLRSTHLKNVSLQHKWHIKRSRLQSTHPDIYTYPQHQPQRISTASYRRPNRKIPKTFAKPATALFRHLGLYKDPSSKTAQRLLKWLRGQDELLLSQVSLVAPRMQFPHIQQVHTHAYQPLRTQLLDYLRRNHDDSSWCLFFSEFVYANPRHQLGDNDTTINGSCLFLMISSEKTAEIKSAAEGMLKKLKYGDELAVFVRNGNPQLFGSYGLFQHEKEYEDEEEIRASEGRSGPAVRAVGWPSFLTRRTEAASSPIITMKPRVKEQHYTPHPASNSANSSIASWIPSPTPSPRSPVRNIRSIHWNKQIYWKDLDAFHYGLRWVTKLAIPSAEEGENARYHERPDIGSSLGARRDFGSGTLAGYMSDNKGEVYTMTCHHVLYFLDSENIWPMRSNSILNRSSTQPISPALHDMKLTTRATGHEIDGLMNEAVIAYIKGNKPLAERVTKEGRKKLLEHDRLVSELDKGGAGFGSIIASAWKIAGMKDGGWIMDQVVVKPRPERIGTNTFTYTGRDNKGGRRYRLEARGWTTLPLGAEVLKIGRTTGLTKGSVISLDADIRLLVGEDQKQTPTIHKVQRFWEIKCGIITSGTGPWFSEPGDSGAWILEAPSFEDMLKWDLRRSGGKTVSDPIPAPVGGMLFGGADSVDGISLTFYNPTKVVRRYLVEMMGDLGRELKPGFGMNIIPNPLDEEWEEQDAWSRQSKVTAKAWAEFVDHGFWSHQRRRYSESHVFRNRKWWEEWERKKETNAWQDKALPTDEGVKYDITARTKAKTMVRAAEPQRGGTPDTTEEAQESYVPESLAVKSVKQKIRFAEASTPRRMGTSDDIPDTPVSTLPRTRRVSPPYVAVERLMNEMTPGRATPKSTVKKA